MRIVKEPEIRKQEILDAAMRVFARKGYEAASMKDIAGEAGVAPGLCYHYFQNKQELYQTAVTRYAKECGRAFAAVFRKTDLSLDACLDELGMLAADQEKTYKYREFFDQAGNELFHKQLELYLSKEIYPHMRSYLNHLAEKNEITADETDLLARFLWGGQMAVIDAREIGIEERIAFIKKMITAVLK